MVTIAPKTDIDFWLLYYITNYALKNDFTFVDSTKSGWEYGWGKPDKFIGKLAIYSLWKNQKVLDYESFSKNKELVNHWRFNNDNTKNG